MVKTKKSAIKKSGKKIIKLKKNITKVKTNTNKSLKNNKKIKTKKEEKNPFSKISLGDLEKKARKKKPKALTISHKPRKPGIIAKEETTKEKVDQLILKGRERGFISHDEILLVFPNAEDDISFVDKLYEKLEEAGITVLESGNLLSLDDDGKDGE
jgi:hypothetical protein